MRDSVESPFLAIDRVIQDVANEPFEAIVLDFHRETTAESMCMAKYLDARVALVYGTHTHVQTNDERISPSGTGSITDVGMTGPIESSVGHTFESRLPRMITGYNFYGEKNEPAVGR